VRRVLGACAWLAVSGALACGQGVGDEQYVVTARYPHDPTAYTQGLVLSGNVLYESTGLYGHSEVRQLDFPSGRLARAVRLDSSRFGEGLALLRGRLYQLTWKAHVGYVYDAATLALADSFHYGGEGWGLTTDGASLIMSDGSDSLRYLSPTTFRVERVVHVRYQGQPVYQINELELVGKGLFANVYETNTILWIDAATGQVRDVLHFEDLYPRGNRPASADVMNGIAATDDGQLLLTGKDWPVMFKVRLRTPPPS
jgi:glutamine cyclotransferase